MITIKDEYKAGNYTVLVLSENIPFCPFNHIKIDDRKYKPEIVYDVENEIAIQTDKSHIGKRIEFVS